MERLLPTRSLTEAGGPQPVEGLPLSLNRKFRTWSYAVSHSELKLRSSEPASSRDVVEVTFYGVLAMKLKAVYKSLIIANADETQLSELSVLADLSESRMSRVHGMALKTVSGDGLVACLSYSVWLHPIEPDHDPMGLARRESTLILRAKAKGS